MFYLKPTEITEVLKLNYISQPFAICAQALGKASVGFLVLNLIGPNTFWRKWFIYINLALFLVLSFLTYVFTFAQCKPSKGLWEPSIGPKCWKPDVSLDTSLTQSGNPVL